MATTPLPHRRQRASVASESETIAGGPVVRLDDVRDQRAIAAALRGDDAGFDAIYRAHVGPLARFVARSLGQSAEAEDVIQETFTTAFTILDRFRGDSALRTWLMGIAWNHIRGVWRTRKKLYPNVAEAAQPSVRNWPQLVARQRIEIVERLLASMTQPGRDVAILVLVHGTSYAECAELLELPVNTVASHVFRARKRLLEAIREADTVAGGLS